MREAGRWYEYEKYGRVPAPNVQQLIRRAMNREGAALALSRQSLVEGPECEMEPAAPLGLLPPPGVNPDTGGYLALPAPPAPLEPSGEGPSQALPPQQSGQEVEPPAKKARPDDLEEIVKGKTTLLQCVRTGMYYCPEPGCSYLHDNLNSVLVHYTKYCKRNGPRQSVSLEALHAHPDNDSEVEGYTD